MAMDLVPDKPGDIEHNNDEVECHPEEAHALPSIEPLTSVLLKPKLLPNTLKDMSPVTGRFIRRTLEANAASKLRAIVSRDVVPVLTSIWGVTSPKTMAFCP